MPPFLNSARKQKNRRKPNVFNGYTSGATRVRTGDPLLAKQMRYQLRYSPERGNT